MIAFFADAVFTDEKGRISLINAGKSEWEFPSYPVEFKQAAIIILPRETMLKGKYPFKFEIVDAIGEVQCGMGVRDMELLDPEKTGTLRFNFPIKIDQPGKHTLICQWGPKAYTLPLVFKTPFDPSMN